MDRDLSEVSKWAMADILYDTIIDGFNESKREYIQNKINVIADYFTENQRTNLRKLGFNVRE